jgi:hypothetical protein
MRAMSTMLVVTAITGAFVVGRSAVPQPMQTAGAQTAATPAGVSQPVDGIPAQFSHFKCYLTNVAAPQPPRVVKLQDQFGIQQTPIGPADMFCTPVKKTLLNAHPLPVPGPADHLLCYRIKQIPVNLPRQIWNQLQHTTIKVTVAQRLCVPTFKKHLD